jgi:signal transduction histidine kinase
MAHRAQRRAGVLEARVASVQGAVGAGERVNHLMRQATLGALTSSLLHDLASTMQTLSAALGEVSLLGESTIPGLGEAVADANAAGEEAVQLFVQMRKFIRAGEVALRPVTIDRIVQRAVRLAGGYVRDRAQLRVSPLPSVTVDVAEPLFLQVLVNLMRNAANASPQHGVVDLKVRVTGSEVILTVVDDGPGVAPEIANYMFEPFASTTHEGTGLGLAISAYVMQLLHGRISYRRAENRGACFTVTLPLDLEENEITEVRGIPTRD